MITVIMAVCNQVSEASPSHTCLIDIAMYINVCVSRKVCGLGATYECVTRTKGFGTLHYD